MHSTNYFSTFISIAEDCPVAMAEVPLSKNGDPTVASLQYEMIAKHPYKYTSDDVIFGVHSQRNNLDSTAASRAEFFARGRSCMRASPLTKRYGWGVHSDNNGKIALVAAGSPEYARLAKDNSIQQTKALRQSR